MTRKTLAAAVALALAAGAVAAQDNTGPREITEEDGKYYDAEGVPTYFIAEDGTVDWYTYSGFRRYHSECHTCHGPDGLGSSYAPALTDSLETMDYGEFLQVVASGRQNVTQGQANVMPAFGTNRNVMCYIDDIWVYLRARSEGALGRGRPAERAPKPEVYAEAEDACMG